MKIYNPENLDLDRIFKGVCNPEYARMFIHIIIATNYRLKHKEGKFVPLNSHLLRKQVHAKKTEIIKRKLIEHGVIECDGIYSPKVKCMGYRLTKKYQIKVSTIEVKNKILLKKLKKTYPPLENEVHKKIWHWLNKVKIDYKAAKQLLVNTKNISQKSLMLEKIHNQDLFFCVDERGRVYHNVACCWSKFRPHLSINCIKLVNVDIKNSQPLIFASILNKHLFNPILFPISCTKSVAPFCQDDIQLFTKLSETGQLYDYLMMKFGIERRNYFKKKFFAEIFYGKTGFQTDLTIRFAELFPNVTKIINYCKKDSYRDLPLEMQRVEAELMIGQVCPRLGDIPFLTVHDSILTLPEHVDYVKKVITEVFNGIGLNPSFGC